MTTANFKYTFPIAKAEERPDGNYIVGFASGPEIDSDLERMAPEAIVRFSEQINATDEETRLVYRDAHAKDGVLRDLGDITKAWVNEHFHLGIEVKLNMDNPAAAFLFKQVKKGKQYGMSVAGHVVEYADEFVAEVGKNVLTYKNVVLDEISNTTRPAWYPSFGTVLAKSVKDASETTEGEAMSKTADAELDTTVEDATKSDATTEVVDETAKADDTAGAAAEETAADETAKSDETVVEETAEKAGRKLSGATSAKLLGLFNSMQEELTSLGVIEAPAAADAATTEGEKSASGAEEDTTEKTAEAASTEAVITKSDLDALASALEKANERIAELEAQPRVAAPGAISDAAKSAAETDFEAELAKASPADRLRLAFAAQTSGR